MKIVRKTKNRYHLESTYEFNKEIDVVLDNISGGYDKYSSIINNVLREHIGSRILAREFNIQYSDLDFDKYPYVTISAELNGEGREFTFGFIKENNKNVIVNGTLTL